MYNAAICKVARERNAACVGEDLQHRRRALHEVVVEFMVKHLEQHQVQEQLPR
jgi:hypothetical protein